MTNKVVRALCLTAATQFLTATGRVLYETDIYAYAKRFERFVKEAE